MRKIAQLIKLKDYISRYEWDIYRYTRQFIRLKREHWKAIYQIWELKQAPLQDKGKKEAQSSREIPFLEDDQINQALQSTMSLEDLKQYFLDELFPLQIKWATSTVTDISFYDKSYSDDEIIKYFLQRFPDIYLLMYQPIFNLNNITIDSELLLISPIQLEIIYWLDAPLDHTFIAHDQRKWQVKSPASNKTMISPLIALNRTEKILQSILKKHQLDYPIQKVVLAKNNQILYSTEPYRTKYIGALQYDQWFERKRSLRSTLKSNQLKVAETLLDYCETVSVKRPEWLEDHTVFDGRED